MYNDESTNNILNFNLEELSEDLAHSITNVSINNFDIFLSALKEFGATIILSSEIYRQILCEQIASYLCSASVCCYYHIVDKKLCNDDMALEFKKRLDEGLINFIKSLATQTNGMLSAFKLKKDDYLYLEGIMYDYLEKFNHTDKNFIGNLTPIVAECTLCFISAIGPANSIEKLNKLTDSVFDILMSTLLYGIEPMCHKIIDIYNSDTLTT